jgi:peptidyl-dipeptidase A
MLQLWVQIVSTEGQAVSLFSRWSQVMPRFEHRMYNDPKQNLGQLWWNLKKKYQLLNPSENVNRPDYGAKVHIVVLPVHYHGYMMGNFFACQVHHYVAKSILKLDNPAHTALCGQPQVGDYLRERVFGPGNLYPWNDLTRSVTGEPLTAKYFAFYIR